MIYSLFGIALRNIRSNKFTMFTSFVSIVLSITLITLIIAFISQAQTALIEDARNRTGGIDVFVSGVITPEYVQAINNLDDVYETLSLHQNHLHVQSRDDVNQNLSVYAVGVENSSIAKNRYEYEMDILDNQAVISLTVSEFLGVTIGEYVIIENKEFEIIEIIGGPGSNFYGFEIIIISFDDFSQILGTNYGNHMGIALNDPLNAVEILPYIRQLDEEMSFDLLIHNLEEVGNLSALQVFIYIFSGIVILACSFMVISNFQVFIENYRKQFSIMRTFGTSGKQLGQILLTQGFFVVGSGAVVGFLLSVLLHTIAFRLFADVLSLPVTIMLNIPSMFFVTFLFSSIVLISLLIPAIECSRMLPMQITQSITQRFVISKWRKKLGAILFILAVLMVILLEIEYRYGIINPTWGVASIFFYTLSFLISFSVILYFFLNKVQKIWSKTSKGVVDVAISNMKNNLLTTKNIMLSIFIVFLVATFAGSMLQSINRNAIRNLESRFFLDINISDILAFESRLDMSFIDELITMEDSNHTVVLSYPQGYLLTNNADGVHADVGYLSLATLVRLGKLDVDIENLDNIVVVTNSFAEYQNLTIGDIFTLWYNPNLTREDWTGTEVNLPITENFIFEIGAIINEFYFAPAIDIYIDWSNRVLPPRNFIFDQAFIQTDDVDRTIDALSILRNIYPEVRWATLNDAIATNNAMFIERYGIFLVMIFFVILSLSLGVVNAIFSGMYSRRKEYAVLRAVGTHQKTIAKTIYLQVFLYIIFGAFAGIVNGMILTTIVILTFDRTSVVFDYFTPIGAFVILSSLLFLTIGKRISELLKEDVLEQLKE